MFEKIFFLLGVGIFFSFSGLALKVTGVCFCRDNVRVVMSLSSSDDESSSDAFVCRLGLELLCYCQGFELQNYQIRRRLIRMIRTLASGSGILCCVLPCAASWVRL